MEGWGRLGWAGWVWRLRRLFGGKGVCPEAKAFVLNLRYFAFDIPHKAFVRRLRRFVLRLRRLSRG